MDGDLDGRPNCIRMQCNIGLLLRIFNTLAQVLHARFPRNKKKKKARASFLFGRLLRLPIKVRVDSWRGLVRGYTSSSITSFGEKYSW